MYNTKLKAKHTNPLNIPNHRTQIRQDKDEMNDSRMEWEMVANGQSVDLYLNGEFISKKSREEAAIYIANYSNLKERGLA